MALDNFLLPSNQQLHLRPMNLWLDRLDLSTLYITTAARNLDMNEHPLAGALFRVQTNTAGLASPSFGG